MTTMNNIAFSVACLALASSVALAYPETRRTRTSVSINLNETMVRQSYSCDMDCRFRLCELDETEEHVMRRATGAMVVLPMRRLIATSPWICPADDSERMGLVTLADEVEVKKDDGTFVKISKYAATSLYNRFARKFVYPMQMNTPASGHRSGLAIRRSLTADQKESIEGRCLKLVIKKYEVLGPSGEVIFTRRDRGPGNCLGFKVTPNPPVIRVELHWSNQDDMDLTVTEPNGSLVGRRSNNSETGGFIKNDVTIGNCGLADQERDVMEYIEWPASAEPLRGEYAVTVRHFSSCNRGPLQWFLFVDINGENFFFETGVHGLEDYEQDVEIDTFLITLTS